MKALSPQLHCGSTLAILGASLFLFWASSELAIATGEAAYVRLAPLVVATISVGFLFQDLQRRRARGPAGHDTREIVESIPGLAWMADASGRLTVANARLRDYLDVAEGDIFSRAQAIHPDDFKRVEGLWSQCLKKGEEFSSTHRVRASDGTHRWFRAVCQPRRDRQGKTVGWCGTLIDLDDQKVAGESLRAQEQQLGFPIDLLPAMICVLTPEGEPSYVNKRLMDYIGIAEIEDLDRAGHGRLASAIRSVVHPDDRLRLQEALGRAFATGEPFAVLHRVRRADGAYRWVEGYGEPVRDSDGRIIGWYSVNADVHERRQAEQELRARERELQQIVDTIPTFVWCITPEGEPTYVNKRLAAYYGRDVDHSEPDEGTRLDRALARLMHPDDLPAVQKNLKHSLTTGESFGMRYRNRRADGIYRWVDARAEPLRDDDGRIVRWYGVSIDIDGEMRAQDALRAAQEKLSRASQFANLAQLSASIAHEVNQPLAAIVANSHACHRWLSADPPNLQRARLISERIVRDAMAAADVVGRVRALYTRKAASRAPTNLNEVIGEVQQLMLDEITSQSILVETDLESGLPSVPADRVQVQQILVNLIRNAIDAMRENVDVAKRLTIRSRRQGPDKIFVRVGDNGRGIADSSRVFDPFFTTKDGGMGMGLAICRSIIEAHQGALWVENVAPRGTVFAFTLPTELVDEA